MPVLHSRLAAIAQLVARRSHNSKVVRSILTRRTFLKTNAFGVATVELMVKTAKFL